jgi:diguanylate cyclase (GGDEF)-like protein/PAS domain S-box-containing protein
MTDRIELLEVALDSFPDGIALFDVEDAVVAWNLAAEAITGYAGTDLLMHPVPRPLETLLEGNRLAQFQAGAKVVTKLGALVRVRHNLGHEVPVMARTLVLRDGLGARIGTAVVFHPAESLDALPHGDTGEDGEVAQSQADLEDRLNTEFEDWIRGGQPFGVMWVEVDQAPELRRTHGAGACHAMLEKVGHALAQGLRPAEEIGRWGQDQFLIISHERTAEMLAAHAKTLAGLARTADFRWWGDRVSLTVSIGAAQAIGGHDETLAQLLESARKAMEASICGGGNSVTSAPGGHTCLPL